MHPRWLAAPIVLALSLRAAVAPAQDALGRSRAEFRRGVADVRAGDYAAARDAFLEAYRLYPHPSILLNLGIARAHTGEWVDAEQDLLHFLGDYGDADEAELRSARAELAQIRGRLGTFRLRVSPAGATAALDGRPIALLPGGFVDVRTTRTQHGLHLAAAGYAPVDRAVIVSGERGPDVDVALAPAALAQPAPPPADARRTAGWFLLGAGVVAAGVGTYAGLEARSLADAYDTRGSGSFQDPATKARGLVFRTSADIAFAGAIVLGGAGLYFLLASAGPPSSQPRLAVGPGWAAGRW
jgi:hypothetical protein